MTGEPMKQRTLTLKQSLKTGTERLEKAGIPEASLDAWFLLSHVTGKDRAYYYGHPDQELTEAEEEAYLGALEKRGRRIPLQHITGQQEFMGYVFHVNEHVLIPRQDTEILVEEALGLLKQGDSVLDMCTGSGCILLSLLKMARERKGIFGLRGTGADISEKALEIAAVNARELEQDVTFIKSDLFSEFPLPEENGKRFQMIVSNPPYIPTEVIEGLQDEVRFYDPRIALDGKEDGLYFYRRITEESVRYIEDGGVLLFETGHDQGEAVAGLMRQAGYRQVQIKKDLAGLDRVVRGVYNVG